MAPTTDSDPVRQNVIRHILEASDEDVKAADVSNETSLRNDLDLSSMQAVTLVMDLEEEFGITIEDEEIAALLSVEDVLELISTKRSTTN